MGRGKSSEGKSDHKGGNSEGREGSDTSDARAKKNERRAKK